MAGIRKHAADKYDAQGNRTVIHGGYVKYGDKWGFNRVCYEPADLPHRGIRGFEHWLQDRYLAEFLGVEFLHIVPDDVNKKLREGDRHYRDRGYVKSLKGPPGSVEYYYCDYVNTIYPTY